MYQGLKKPDSIENFLTLFIGEFYILQNDGMVIGDKKVFLRINKVICDASVKSFLLYIKGYTGSSSCTKCIVEGDFSNNRICFNRLEKSFLENRRYVQTKI